MQSSQGTILLVEDDRAIRRSLSATLKALDFEIGEASTGEEGLTRLRRVEDEAGRMDLKRPGTAGVESCRRVRQEFPHLSILVVTVRDNEEDKIEALDAGADDYITKPFQIRELTARIRAAVRRRRTPAGGPEPSVHVGIFELQPARRILKKRGQELQLTPTEFDLLALLMGHANRPVPHARLLSTVWGSQYRDEREYLRTFILQLRRKLEDDPSNPLYLKTVNYLGYVFRDPDEESL